MNEELPQLTPLDEIDIIEHIDYFYLLILPNLPFVVDREKNRQMIEALLIMSAKRFQKTFAH